MVVAAAFALGCGRFHFDELGPCPTIPGCASAIAFRCPSGRCYAICPEPADRPTQDALCTAAGMDLATIETAADDACIAAKLPLSLEWYWIGLAQAPGAMAPGDNWFWPGGEPLAFANWWEGDPNPPHNPDDFDGIEDGTEQCVWTRSEPPHQWEDAGCNNSNPGAVCEP